MPVGDAMCRQCAAAAFHLSLGGTTGRRLLIHTRGKVEILVATGRLHPQSARRAHNDVGEAAHARAEMLLADRGISTNLVARRGSRLCGGGERSSFAALATSYFIVASRQIGSGD
jgi:hypothetical protein